MPALVDRHNLFQHSKKTEDNNESYDSMPSLEHHPGSDSSSDVLESLGSYALGMLGKYLDKTEANLIVELDDAQSGVSMTSSDSSKSCRICICVSLLLVQIKSCTSYTWKMTDIFWITWIILKLARILRHWSAKNTGLCQFG